MQEQFQPRYNERQTRRILERYKGRAERLSEERKEELEQHAAYYNVPFYTGDFSVKDAIWQAANGFWEGFTTLPGKSEQPDNEYEAIFKNIGHLIGFAPGIASKPLKAIGAHGLARKAAGLRSVPLKGADIISDYVKTKTKSLGFANVARNEAFDTASKFYLGQKSRGAIGQMADEAFHLGTASAISSYKYS